MSQKRKLALAFQQIKGKEDPEGEGEKLISPRKIQLEELAKEFMDERYPSPDKPVAHGRVWVEDMNNPHCLVYRSPYDEALHKVDLQKFRPNPLRGRGKLVPEVMYDALLHFKLESNVLNEELPVLRKIVIISNKDSSSSSYFIL